MKHLTLISAYAPTMLYTQGQKELLSQTFQACYILLQRVIRSHRVGQNSNGQLLLTFCAEQGLTITNSLFQLLDIHKVTWMHPRSRHWHLIDYVTTGRHDIKDVEITRAMREANCWIDHLLLRTRLSFSIASRHIYKKN